MELKKVMESLTAVATDKRVSIWHIGIYIAIVQLWHNANLCNPVSVTRRKIMHLAHVGSIATYHKCIKELERYGYIRYLPSHHPWRGSKVFLPY